MASLILLSNLLLTTNPGVESVYQHMLEATFKAETAAALKLEDVIQQICDVWAARFGGFPSNQQPCKGAVYDKGKASASHQPKQKQQVQVQQNTAIKGKGPNPSYSEEQSADSGSSQQKRRRPLRRGGKGKGAHSHMAGAPDSFQSDFVLASSAMHITDTPAIPAPTVHIVASFTAAGPLIRHEKTTGPWKNPGRSTPPYPHVQRSHHLMSCCGVTPTIQTSKEFEGIVSLEVVVDETAGAPTVKLGAYALSDLPRAPTPEMAPLLDRMVIDVPSDNEGDTVSLGEDDNLVPVDSNLFGSPIPQVLKLDIDDDDSDYREDPKTLCGLIIEPAPSLVCVRGADRQWYIPEGNTGTKGMSSWSGRWSDDHDAYEGPTDNELVPFCSHEGTLLTDPSTASTSVDIDR